MFWDAISWVLDADWLSWRWLTVQTLRDALFLLCWNTLRTAVTRSLPGIALTVIRTRTSHCVLCSDWSILVVCPTLDAWRPWTCILLPWWLWALQGHGLHFLNALFHLIQSGLSKFWRLKVYLNDLNHIQCGFIKGTLLCFWGFPLSYSVLFRLLCM